METEDKAKAVASVSGSKFVQFLAALETVEFSRSIWKKRLNLTDSSKYTEAKQIARQETFLPQTDATTFALPSVSILIL